jgi:hypothetical protein
MVAGRSRVPARPGNTSVASGVEEGRVLDLDVPNDGIGRTAYGAGVFRPGVC